MDTHICIWKDVNIKEASVSADDSFPPGYWDESHPQCVFYPDREMPFNLVFMTKKSIHGTIKKTQCCRSLTATD